MMRILNQDNEIVVLTLAHVLEDLEKMLDYSKSIGCYLSAATIEFLHWVSDTTKMDLGSYSFSEAQTGKSASTASSAYFVLKEIYDTQAWFKDRSCSSTMFKWQGKL
ncbi:hypothetical protein L5515_019220 [Caenorhabditis briggsae]|uniref:Uncharacterized protein n=1 Tax=Caenorhabditis briggsae TaxID=6238 RepID=A0AAE9FHS5_CAEBR|nr:hypothetical protein L5515_019220 [Caenorhabditis briggsae]